MTPIEEIVISITVTPSALEVPAGVRADAVSTNACMSSSRREERTIVARTLAGVRDKRSIDEATWKSDATPRRRESASISVTLPARVKSSRTS